MSSTTSPKTTLTQRVLSRVASPGLRRILAMLQVQPKQLALAVMFGVLALGSAVSLAAVSAWLIARASQMPPVLDLSLATVAVRAFGISRGVNRYMERLSSHRVALGGMDALRINVFERLSAGSPRTLATLRRGDLMNRTSTDIEAVGDIVVKAVIPVLTAAGVGLVSTLIMLSILPSAGVLFVVLLVASGFSAVWLTNRTLTKIEAQRVEVQADMAAHSLDYVDYAAQMRVAGKLGDMRRRVLAAETQDNKLTDRSANPLALAMSLNVAAEVLSVFGALVLGVMAHTQGELSSVMLAVVVLTPLAAFEATMALPEAVRVWLRGTAAAERIDVIIEQVADAPAQGSSTPGTPVQVSPESPSPVAPLPPSSSPVAPVISAEDLTYGWPGAPILGQVSFEFNAGSLNAILGPSGVGKTTLLLTLAEFLPALGGSLRRNGAAAYVAEDAHIFRTTVLENLRVARGDVTPSEALEMLHAVGLGTWLEQLPDGIDTIIGTEASTVSGGERRRLLLARALLSDNQILLLDEPLEHIDRETAPQIVQLLREWVRGGERIVVYITHNPVGLDMVDQVITLQREGFLDVSRTVRAT